MLVAANKAYQQRRRQNSELQLRGNQLRAATQAYHLRLGRGASEATEASLARDAVARTPRPQDVDRAARSPSVHPRDAARAYARATSSGRRRADVGEGRTAVVVPLAAAAAAPPELELAIDDSSGDATVMPRGELTTDPAVFAASLHACLDGLAEVTVPDGQATDGNSRPERRVWLKLARADAHLVTPALSLGFDFSSAKGGVGGHVLLTRLVQTTRRLVNRAAMQLAQRAMELMEAAQVDTRSPGFLPQVFDLLRTISSLSTTQDDQIADAEAAVRYILATRRSSDAESQQPRGDGRSQASQSQLERPWSPVDSTDSDNQSPDASLRRGHTGPKDAARTFFMRAQDRRDGAEESTDDSSSYTGSPPHKLLAEPEPEPEPEPELDPEPEPEPEPEDAANLSPDKLVEIERWLDDEAPDSSSPADPVPAAQLDFKRQIIAYLQAHAEEGFLRKHGLIGLVPSLRKRRNKIELRHAYQDWLALQNPAARAKEKALASAGRDADAATLKAKAEEEAAAASVAAAATAAQAKAEEEAATATAAAAKVKAEEEAAAAAAAKVKAEEEAAAAAAVKLKAKQEAEAAAAAAAAAKLKAEKEETAAAAAATAA
jgi:hypothetical protein